MEKKIIKSDVLNEEYISIDHKSGLKLLLCPMKGYQTSYAMFGTNYGSLNTCFKTDKDNDFVKVPEGIAHFLEHKVFESEDGVDAFERYAKTGASANAFTSFDKTCYLFACSDNFEESLEILLDFVKHPYFTKENVQKEQGIIGQEIKMYDDNPDWRVYFNLLKALYINHPINIDIAGTVESISHIDDKLLYKCYNTFYNLNNMVLAIAGNFDVESVLKVADKILEKDESITIENKVTDEPLEVNQKEIKINLPVSIPMFQVGYKGKNNGLKQNFIDQVTDEVILQIVAGETTELYNDLYQKGLINLSFGTEAMAGFDYNCIIFSGESEKPYEVQQAISKRIKELQQNRISQEEFDRAKKVIYGRYIGMLSRTEAVANILTATYFAGIDMYELIKIVANMTKETAQKRLDDNFDTERSAISIVAPID